jgi:hypothetical protein
MMKGIPNWMRFFGMASQAGKWNPAHASLNAPPPQDSMIGYQGKARNGVREL